MHASICFKPLTGCMAAVSCSDGQGLCGTESFRRTISKQLVRRAPSQYLIILGSHRDHPRVSSMSTPVQSLCCRNLDTRQIVLNHNLNLTATQPPRDQTPLYPLQDCPRESISMEPPTIIIAKCPRPCWTIWWGGKIELRQTQASQYRTLTFIFYRIIG